MLLRAYLATPYRHATTCQSLVHVLSSHGVMVFYASVRADLADSTAAANVAMKRVPEQLPAL